MWVDPNAYIDGDEPTAAEFNLWLRDNLGALLGSGNGAGTEVALAAVLLSDRFELTGASADLVQPLSGTAAQMRVLSQAPSIANGQQVRLVGVAGSLPTEDEDIQATRGITEPRFSGIGLDDFSAYVVGEFTGTDGTEYVVEIDGEGSPDTFRLSRDGGETWIMSSVAITGGQQDLGFGVYGSFADTTGHTVGTSWRFTAYKLGEQEPLGALIGSRDSAGTGRLEIRRAQGNIIISSSQLVATTAGVGIGGINTPTYPFDVYGTLNGAAYYSAGALIGQWTSTFVSLPRFTGSGLDDLASSMKKNSAFTGLKRTRYIVEVESVGTHDTVRWSDDDGQTWTSGVDMVALPATVTLSHNVEVGWGASTGHTIGDRWELWGSPDPIMRYDGSAQVTGQLEAMGGISSVQFDGEGISDISVSLSGDYTGEDGAHYVVQIDGTAAPNTFRWSRDGGVSWVQQFVPLTGAAQALEHNLQVTFGATGGHTLEDTWHWNVFAAGFGVESEAQVSNLNVGLLQGFPWPVTTSEQQQETPEVRSFTISSVAERDGFYFVFAEATAFVGSGDEDVSLFRIEIDGYEPIEIRPRVDGEHVQLFNIGIIMAGAGEEISVKALREDAFGDFGENTSRIAGSFTAEWLAPPAAQFDTPLSLTLELPSGLGAS